MKPAIVIAAYNRATSLERLLAFVSRACYAQRDVPLVISVDGGGSPQVIEIAQKFEWKYGEKRLILHEENLGLRNHILSCGDLSFIYGAVIVLEDDLIVGPGFYNYSSQTLQAYDDDANIAGVSLYSYRNNENESFNPFFPLDNGMDVYFMQVPSSWGQAWTSSQWERFKNYYAKCSPLSANDMLPSNVLNWPETSWKKYFFKYIVEKDLYFVYPYLSHSSNCGDAGTHFYQMDGQVRVQLSLVGEKCYAFPVFSKNEVVYDAFFEIYPDYLKSRGVKPDDDFGVDLFGVKDLDRFHNKLFFSFKACANPLMQFGMELFPAEQNIIYDITGDKINYANRDTFGLRPDCVEMDWAKLYCQNIFELGRQVGMLQGMKKKSDSLSYKIGRIMTSPYRTIVNLFTKS